MGLTYATREAVASALGFNESARLPTEVDRACHSASRMVESLCHRVFYPTNATRTILRDLYRNGYETLWLDTDELVSLTSVTLDGTAVESADYDLVPTTGPPFTGINFGGSVSSGEFSIVGVFGYRDDQVPAGVLEAAISSASATTIDVTDGSLVGVGDLLTVDTERLQVTERTWLTSAQTGSLTASKAATTLAVTTGSAFHIGEPLLIGSERLLITDISGNNLTVRRAQDGTVLAAHTTATIYTSRTMTVVRGAVGTTAATHLDAATVTRIEYPGLVRSLTIALACNQLLQEGSGYATVQGNATQSTPATGGGLDAIRRDCYALHGRKARTRSV